MLGTLPLRMLSWLPKLLILVFLVLDFRRHLPKENRKAYIKKKATHYAFLVCIGLGIAVFIQYVATGESWLITLVRSLFTI